MTDTGRDDSLDFRCVRCGAAPGEMCELNTGQARFESHPGRMKKARSAAPSRKQVVLPALVIGSLEMALLVPQKIEKCRIPLVIPPS